jgi:hypothetical protein
VDRIRLRLGVAGVAEESSTGDMKTLGGDIMEEKKKEQDLWLKVFCPNTRCLTDQEVAALPEEKRKLAETEEDQKGFWLKLFCPEDECVLDQPTDLP